MKKHTKIYLDFFEYDQSDYIPCEVTGQRGADIHHIDARGMGGSDEKDYIENLIAVTRRVHDLAEARRIPPEAVLEIHLSFMKAHQAWDANGSIAMKLHFAFAKRTLQNLGITAKDLA